MVRGVGGIPVHTYLYVYSHKNTIARVKGNSPYPSEHLGNHKRSTRPLEERPTPRILVNLIAIQPTSPLMAVLAPDFAPVPAHAAEAARRFIRQGWAGAGGVVG